MATYWRISNHADLSGKGGLIGSGRWHSKGRPIVYLAETPAGAMLETLVHLEMIEGKMPPGYLLIEIEAPDHLGIEVIEPVGEDWKVDIERTHRLGDAWLAESRTALARVPSAIVSKCWNILLNPRHPDAGRVLIVAVTQERFDQRLLRAGVR
jgi:RES domain-containing protein